MNIPSCQQARVQKVDGGQSATCSFLASAFDIVTLANIQTAEKMSSNSSVSIPEARIRQVNQITQSYVSDFCNKSGPKADEYISNFHPNVEWYDHAFHICRVGRTALLGLQESFLHCNQPFDATIKVSDCQYRCLYHRMPLIRAQAITPTPEGAVVEQVWHVSFDK